MIVGALSLLLLLAAVATASWSLYVCFMLLTETCAAHPELEYISTRLARCLDARAGEVWSLVFCVQFQILLLLVLWRRLLGTSHHFVTMLRPWVISFGVCFVVNFAMVVEFRNDRTALSRRVLGLEFKESDLHAYAAVVTMTSFTLLHALLCLSLLKLSAYQAEATRRTADESTANTASNARGDGYRAIDFRLQRPDAGTPDSEEGDRVTVSASSSSAKTPAEYMYTFWAHYRKSLVLYAELDWVYFMTIIIFFVTWFLNNPHVTNQGLYSTAVHTEWVVLAIAAFMHAYALAQSYRPLKHLPVSDDSYFTDVLQSLRTVLSCSMSWYDVGLCFFFVVSFFYTLLIFAFAPLATSEAQLEDTQHLHSSPLLLLAVLSSYTCGALLQIA